MMVAIIHCLFLSYQSNVWKCSLKLGQPRIHITLAQWRTESKGVMGFSTLYLEVQRSPYIESGISVI